MKQHWSKVVQRWKTVLLTLSEVGSTLFQRWTLPLYQGCTMLKIRRQILFYFQGRIKVIATFTHNVQTKFIRRWKSSWDWASTTFLYTSLRLQIPCTSSPHTTHLYNTYNRRRIWNPTKHLQRVLFVNIVNLLRPLTIFAGELHRRCLQDSKCYSAQ